MEQNIEFKQQLIQEYKENVMPLLRYLPWLEKNAGKNMSSFYNDDNMVNSISIPVYDGTLMNFVKEAAKSPLMDKNYKYIYTRNHIKNHDDERRVIKAAGWREWNVLCGILSYYVLGGRTKGTLWSEAVEEQIFYLLLKQMREIIEYWDQPIILR